MQVRTDHGRVLVGDDGPGWWDMTPAQARKLADLLLAAATMATCDSVDAFMPSKRRVVEVVAEGDAQ